MKYYRFFLIMALSALLVGCLPASSGGETMNVARSEKPRAAAQELSAQEQHALAAGNAEFALDLYHQLARPGENVFYSPYSISAALAMVYGGAKGTTASEMAGSLHFTLPAERLHAAFNAVDQALASRKDVPGAGADGKGFRLNIANDIWGQQDEHFLPAYLDLLAQNYGAGLRPVDFKTNPEAVRKLINEDIAQKTEQRIKDLLAPGAVDGMTRLVLTNAIYFNAAWAMPFEKTQTKDGKFTREYGTQVSVPMMKRPPNGFVPYAAGDGYQAVALPYENDDLAMLLLVPDAGTFADFEARMDAAMLETVRAGMQPASVNLTMPRFQLESSLALKTVLEALGMKAAFDPGQADFSGINGKDDLFISAVVHKAFVAVDEAGTEAAAATAVIMPASAMIDEPVKLTIDRPFIFLIVDQPTGTVLFAGKVADPQGQ